MTTPSRRSSGAATEIGQIRVGGTMVDIADCSEFENSNKAIIEFDYGLQRVLVR